MIKNQWYAVLSSHQLKKGQVLGARRFGEDLVFYRTGGKRKDGEGSYKVSFSRNRI